MYAGTCAPYLVCDTGGRAPPNLTPLPLPQHTLGLRNAPSCHCAPLRAQPRPCSAAPPTSATGRVHATSLTLSCSQTAQRTPGGRGSSIRPSTLPPPRALEPEKLPCGGGTASHITQNNITKRNAPWVVLCVGSGGLSRSLVPVDRPLAADGRTFFPLNGGSTIARLRKDGFGGTYFRGGSARGAVQALQSAMERYCVK